MKYALFTGGAGGLGGACAKAMAAEGWTVFAADINDAALAEIGEVENIIPIKVDITNQESVDAAHEEVAKYTTKLDAVINFAGMHTMCSMIEGNCSNTIEKMLMINVMGMVRINRTFIDMVMEGNGRVVNCSSECGYLTAQPFNGPYAITKYAVEAYTDSLRRELMFIGVPVVKIQPGSFKTNMHKSASAGLDNLINSTKYYGKVLNTLRPIMDNELKHANDPKYLVAALLEAVDSDKPKIVYRVKNSAMLRALELVPTKLLEFGYRVVIK